MKKLILGIGLFFGMALSTLAQTSSPVATLPTFLKPDGTVAVVFNGSTISVAGLKVLGATSGGITLAVPAMAGTNTITFPAGTTDFTATGGTGQVLRQSSAAGAFTVGALTLASTDFANQGTTTTVLHGNAAGNPAFGSVTSLDVANSVAITGVDINTSSQVTATHLASPLPVAQGGTAAGSASITAFNNITGYSAAGATGTTSTNLVFSGTPTIATPSFTTGFTIGGAAAVGALTIGNGTNFIAGAVSSNLTLSASTLDTIQGIQTTSTPQFARLGIGAIASGSNLLQGPNGSILDSNGAFVNAYVGPHAVGGATNSQWQWLQTGTYSNASYTGGFALASTIVPAANNAADGIYLSPTFTKASSGTHSEFAAFRLAGITFNAGASAVTNVTGMDLLTFTAPASTTTAIGLRVVAPTSASNNYSISSSGRVSMLNLTSAGVAQTDDLCLNSSSEVIAVTAGSCIASTRRVKHGIADVQFGVGLPIDPLLTTVDGASMTGAITPTPKSATDIILALHPVNFFYNQTTGKTDINHTMQQFGLIAEEVVQVDPRLVAFLDDGSPYTVRYLSLIPILIKENQELIARVAALESGLVAAGAK